MPTLRGVVAQTCEVIHVDIHSDAVLLHSRQEREGNVRRAEQDSALELEEAKHSKTLQMSDRAHAQRIKHMREEREIELSFYEGLKARAGVDITQLLVAKEASSSLIKSAGPRRSEVDSTLKNR